MTIAALAAGWNSGSGLTAWFSAAAIAAVGSVLVVLGWMMLRRRRVPWRRMMDAVLGRRPRSVPEPTRIVEPSRDVPAEREEAVRDLNRALAAYRSAEKPGDPVTERVAEPALDEYLKRLQNVAERLETLAEQPRPHIS